MNDRELARRLKAVLPRMTTSAQRRVQDNVGDYIAHQPIPKRHIWRTILLAGGLVLALISSVGAVVAPYMAIVSGLSIALLGVPMLLWSTALHTRFNMHALQRVLVVMIVLGLALSSSATVFAAVHLPEIYARLVQLTPKEQSSTQHTELRFQLGNCPSFGSSSRTSSQRYALSNRATISPAEAEKVVQAQCIEQVAKKTAAKKWRGIRADDPSLQEGQAVKSYNFYSAAQAITTTPLTLSLGGGKTQTFDQKPTVIDIDGRPIDLAVIQPGSVVIPVFASTTTVHISYSGERRNAIPRSTSTSEQKLVGLVSLPSEVDFKYYNAILRSQLVAIRQCEANPQDDCVAALSPVVIMRQSVTSAEARIQGRVIDNAMPTLKVQSQPSGRIFTVQLPESITDAQRAQLNAGAFVEVKYRTSAQTKTSIPPENIAWVYILGDAIKKHDNPQPF